MSEYMKLEVPDAEIIYFFYARYDRRPTDLEIKAIRLIWQNSVAWQSAYTIAHNELVRIINKEGCSE